MVTSLTSFLRVKEILNDIIGLGIHSTRDRVKQSHEGHLILLEGCERDLSSSDLELIIQAITSIIDLDQDSVGEKSGGLLIAPGILPELDELKAIYESLPSILDQSMNEFIKRIPRSLMSSKTKSAGWRIVYIPQIGYMLRTATCPGEGIIDSMEDVKLEFVDGEAKYYTTHETLTLSNNFGDIYARLLDAESSILLQLKKKCIQSRPCIEAAARATATLDCLLAFAKIARINDYCRPQMFENNKGDFIFIEDGRHAIQEQRIRLEVSEKKEDAFIPNTSQLGISGKARINIITGPNNSGKTMYV